MDPRPTVRIPRSIFTVLNQLYELEQKLARHGDPAGLGRHVAKMRDAFAEEGLTTGGGGRVCLTYEDPLGQRFDETRTDLEATIAGPRADDLVVVEVVRPVIRAVLGDGFSTVVQTAVVVVESRARN
jgi:hypothetical protein